MKAIDLIVSNITAKQPRRTERHHFGVVLRMNENEQYDQLNKWDNFICQNMLRSRRSSRDYHHFSDRRKHYDPHIRFDFRNFLILHNSLLKRHHRFHNMAFASAEGKTIQFYHHVAIHC